MVSIGLYIPWLSGDAVGDVKPNTSLLSSYSFHHSFGHLTLLHRPGNEQGNENQGPTAKCCLQEMATGPQDSRIPQDWIFLTMRWARASKMTWETIQWKSGSRVQTWREKDICKVYVTTKIKLNTKWRKGLATVTLLKIQNHQIKSYQMKFSLWYLEDLVNYIVMFLRCSNICSVIVEVGNEAGATHNIIVQF